MLMLYVMSQCHVNSQRPNDSYVTSYTTNELTKRVVIRLFARLWYIWFIFGTMIDIGPKFYAVPPQTRYMTLRSRSQT